MFSISNKTRQVSHGKTRFNDTDFGTNIKTNIAKANTASLYKILNQYGVKIDAYSNKDRCPFSFHKNGFERSSSFYYYKNTNSFNCFGCNHGGGPVEFVSLIEDLSKEDAAIKINNDYETNAEISNNFIPNFEITQKILLDFSKTVREFIYSNLDSELSAEYAEKVTFIFDTITSKHNLDIEGLRSITKKLTTKLNQYNSDNT